jgi:AraC-like DNA-binding protein
MNQHDTTSSRMLIPQAGASRAVRSVDEGIDLLTLQQLRSAVTELFIALNETLRDERSKAAECLTRAEALLEALPQAPVEQATLTPPQGLAPWQVQRVVTYVDSNLNTSVRNKDLAAIARLSEFHFNVAFRKRFGQSPHEYLIRRRIERAQGLMLSTDMALSEIAMECGLADQSHLTRLFRKVSGESPAAWRRARVNPR